MTRTKRIEAQFEDGLRVLSLSTWNRPRSTSELRSFLSRRELIVEDIEL